MHKAHQTINRASHIPELECWSDPPNLQNTNVKKSIRSAWKRHFGLLCEPCGCKMHFEPKYREKSDFATIDHVLGRGLGGSDHLRNIQVICLTCNHEKSKEEFYQCP